MKIRSVMIGLVLVLVLLGCAHADPLSEGVAALRARDLPKAIELLKQAVEQNPKSVPANLYLGIAYFASGDAPNATTQLQRVLELDPDNKDAKKYLAVINHKDKAYLSTDETAREHLMKGEALFRQQNYKEAIAEYKLSAQADPRFGKPYVYVGDAYWAMGDFDNAVLSYRKAIGIDPNDEQAWRFLGDVYEKRYDRTGEKRFLDLALDAYENAVRIDPEYPLTQSALEKAKAKKAKLPTPEETK